MPVLEDVREVVGVIKKGWELEKIHSIRRLIAIAENFEISVPLQDEEMDFIDSIYKGRYSGEEGASAT